MNFLLVCTKTVCCRSRDYQEDHVHCTHCTAWVSKVRGTMFPSHPRLRRPCVCLFLLFIWLSASRSPKLHVRSLPKKLYVLMMMRPLSPRRRGCVCLSRRSSQEAAATCSRFAASRAPATEAETYRYLLPAPERSSERCSDSRYRDQHAPVCNGRVTYTCMYIHVHVHMPA